MKFLLPLLIMGIVLGQKPSHTWEQIHPKAKIPFELNYYDIRQGIYEASGTGKIIVEFYINEAGEVENPIIIDTFNVSLNDVILDKVRQSTYYPAIQNGKPVKVKYSLPIQFK